MSRFVLVFCVAVVATRCGTNGTSAPAQMAPPALDVQTLTLAPRPIARTSEFVGVVRSLRSTTVQPQVEGFVRQIVVKAGDRVAAGQPLLRIDPDRRQAAATVTRAQRAAREADLALAAQTLARSQALFQAGAISRSAVDEAEATHASARAQLDSLLSQIGEDEVELRYYTVTAPTSGVVGDVPVRTGDRVTPQSVITTIDGSEGLEVYVNVPLEQATSLAPGLPLELLDGDGKVMTSLRVAFVAPRTDDATQSVLIKAPVGTTAGLRTMQYVRTRLVWSNDASLSVPLVAVTRVSGQYFVFVAEPTEGGFVARQRPVALGEVTGDHYVVRTGLAAGERVVVSNIQKIGDGSPIKPL